jgi:hypothetical protein
MPITYEFEGSYPPKAIKYRYCPKSPDNHWIVNGDRCAFCNCKVVEVRYTPAEDQ